MLVENKIFQYENDGEFRQYVLCLFGFIICWNKEVGLKDRSFTFPKYICISLMFNFYGWHFMVSRLRTVRKHFGIK